MFGLNLSRIRKNFCTILLYNNRVKFEFSAGGVVYKKENGKILILVSQHSQHHGWVFPKGLIGDNVKGERKEDTAVREVKEETGVEAKIVEALKPVTYWYVFSPKGRLASGKKGEKIKKTVYYYIMEYLEGDIKKHDQEMENVEWVEFDKILEKLTYKSDKEAFEEAKPIIEKLSSS